MEQDQKPLLKTLDGARRRSIPWHQVASALNDLESSKTLDASGRTWIKIAADISGYTVNHIRRFQASLHFLEQVELDFSLISNGNIRDISVSHLETISRIWKIDADFGLKLLDSSLKGTVTQATLERQLKNLTAGERSTSSHFSAGKIAAQKFRDVCFDLIDEAAMGIDKKSSIIPKAGLRYPNPDFLFVSESGGERLRFTGLDMYDLRGVDQGDVIKKVILPELMKATFFDVLWIICAGEQSWYLQSQIREMGGGDNIGVMQVAADFSAKYSVDKPVGRPVPDRTQIWLREMSPWLRKRIEASGFRLSTAGTR